MAAGLLLAAGLAFMLLSGPGDQALAEDLPIEVQRRGIQVTIFSKSENIGPTLFMPLVAPTPWRGSMPQQQRASVQQMLGPVNMQVGPGYRPTMQQSPGMALVKDQRMVLHLRKGDNIVKFTDVAVSIDPTSVRLVSDTDPLGTKVVEQNFEFDLASADALLKKSIEKEIICIDKNGEQAGKGFLLSYDDQTIVLADRIPSPAASSPAGKALPAPKTETISRGELQAVRIGEMPDDLYTRPTLVWILRTEQPGNHLTTLTYLCGNVVWRADYVAVITDSSPEGDRIDLKGWVTIDNRSGATFKDAGLKLIAGDVNRVRDPWAVPLYHVAPPVWEGEKQRANVLQQPSIVPKEFAEKSFFEYKLYTLNQPSTIKDRQIKQLSLFKASGIKAVRRYVCRSTQGGNLHPDVQLLIQNEKQNNLGRPLPKGMVTLTAVDADGDSQFLGRQEIDHTPKDEELRITMGQAFDVVYGYRVVDTERPSSRRMIQTYEFRIRNHKRAVVNVRAIGHLAGYANWKVTKTTDPFSKHDFQTLHFDVDVEPDTEKTITYTVDYRWSQTQTVNVAPEKGDRHRRQHESPPPYRSSTEPVPIFE